MKLSILIQGGMVMLKIKLNKDFGMMVKSHGFELNPKEEYIINMKEELEQQTAIVTAVQTMGLPAMKDYHEWLMNNGFNAIMPNPTNEFVSKFYGKSPLWITELSQGIVVKAEDDDDFFIVMECSRLNEGFKYTQIIVTLGGCM